MKHAWVTLIGRAYNVVVEAGSPQLSSSIKVVWTSALSDNLEGEKRYHLLTLLGLLLHIYLLIRLYGPVIPGNRGI